MQPAAPATAEGLTGGATLVTSSRLELPWDIGRAACLAATMGSRYVRRAGRTVQRLLDDEGADDAVVVSAAGAVWRDRAGGTFQFHPNMGLQRLRAVAEGRTDTLLRAAEVRPGDRILDATLGLGADAAVLSAAAGPAGWVVGLEVSPVLAALVALGLATYQHRLAAPMHRVQVVCGDHREHLTGGSRLARAGWDVIVLDPMFDRPLPGAAGLAGLRRLACHDPLEAETIAAARSLVARAVVVKGRAGDEWLAALGPERLEGGRRGRTAFAVFGPQ